MAVHFHLAPFARDSAFFIDDESRSFDSEKLASIKAFHLAFQRLCPTLASNYVRCELMTAPPTDSDPHFGVERSILTQLASTGFSKSWIQSVQKLSNHYVANPDAISPWSESWAREALLSYYHPLNQARAERVAKKGDALGFFDGISHMVDLGCGSGAAALGFLFGKPGHFEALELSDHSVEIAEIAEKLITGSALSPNKLSRSQRSIEHFSSRDIGPHSLLLLSYVLTESRSNEILDGLLDRHGNLEAIAILEPSTSQDGRRLQRLRPVLMKHGYHLWAPCTHEKECPLLKDSDRDWCHDRTVPHLPAWWTELEAGLPMKNKTVTVSYLLARKRPRTGFSASEEVRVIGDRLEEKTKVRQMICRGENREFISWFPSRLKDAAESFDLERGDRFISSPDLWQDPRGIDRSREYRLNLEAIRHIESTRRG